MDATNHDMEWAQAKLRWVLERIAARLELDAALYRRIARSLRAWR